MIAWWWLVVAFVAGVGIPVGFWIWFVTRSWERDWGKV